jgi:hypothetical protein
MSERRGQAGRSKVQTEFGIHAFGGREQKYCNLVQTGAIWCNLVQTSVKTDPAIASTQIA